MPQVKRVSKLPPAVRREVEERLAAEGFGGYVELAAELRRRGYRVSKTSLHRFGQEMKAIQRQADEQAMRERAAARARAAAEGGSSE